MIRTTCATLAIVIACGSAAASDKWASPTLETYRPYLSRLTDWRNVPWQNQIISAQEISKAIGVDRIRGGVEFDSCMDIISEDIRNSHQTFEAGYQHCVKHTLKRLGKSKASGAW